MAMVPKASAERHLDVSSLALAVSAPPNKNIEATQAKSAQLQKALHCKTHLKFRDYGAK